MSVRIVLLWRPMALWPPARREPSSEPPRSERSRCGTTPFRKTLLRNRTVPKARLLNRAVAKAPASEPLFGATPFRRPRLQNPAVLRTGAPNTPEDYAALRNGGSRKGNSGAEALQGRGVLRKGGPIAVTAPLFCGIPASEPSRSPEGWPRERQNRAFLVAPAFATTPLRRAAFAPLPLRNARFSEPHGSGGPGFRTAAL